MKSIIGVLIAAWVLVQPVQTILAIEKSLNSNPILKELISSGQDEAEKFKMMKVMTEFLHYPYRCQESNVQGRVMTEVVVGADGIIADVRTISSPSATLSAEVKSAISKISKCLQIGERKISLRGICEIPVLFRLVEDEKDTILLEKINSQWTIVVAASKSSAGWRYKPPYSEKFSIKRIGGIPSLFYEGKDQLADWVHRHLVYPDSCKKVGLQGKVDVKLTYRGYDSVGVVEIVQSSNDLFAREVEQLLEKMPAKPWGTYFDYWEGADYTEYYFSFFFRQIPVRASSVGDSILLVSDYEGVDIIAWQPNSKDAVLDTPLPIYTNSYDNRSFYYDRYLEGGKVNISDRVLVYFQINEECKICHPKVISASHPALASEALRLVGLKESWYPTYIDSERMVTDYVLPITFLYR